MSKPESDGERQMQNSQCYTAIGCFLNVENVGQKRCTVYYKWIYFRKGKQKIETLSQHMEVSVDFQCFIFSNSYLLDSLQL